MTLLGIVGTVAFLAIVVLSLLAVVDVLFSRSNRRKHGQSHDRGRKLHRRRIW